jgi:hypothetical protein
MINANANDYYTIYAARFFGTAFSPSHAMEESTDANTRQETPPGYAPTHPSPHRDPSDDSDAHAHGVTSFGGHRFMVGVFECRALGAHKSTSRVGTYARLYLL